MKKLHTFVHGSFLFHFGIQALAFSGDRRLLASGGGPYDARVVVFDLAALRCIGDFDLLQDAPYPKHGQITALRFAPDGTLLALGDPADFPGEHFRAWNTTRGELVEAVDGMDSDHEAWRQIWARWARPGTMPLDHEDLPRLDDFVRSLLHTQSAPSALSSVDTAAVTLDDEIGVIEITNGRPIARAPLAGYVQGIAISASGNMVAAALDDLDSPSGGAVLFVAAGGSLAEVARVNEHEKGAAVALSRLGDRLAVATAQGRGEAGVGTVGVWRVSSADAGWTVELVDRQSCPERVGALAFSPDDSLLAVGCVSGVELYELETTEVDSEQPAGTVWPLRHVDEAKVRFVSTRAEVGRIDEALRVAHSIRDSEGRATALRGIAVTQARSGLDATHAFAAALEAAREIDDGKERDEAFAELAHAGAQLQKVSFAVETARLIEHRITMAYTLAKIAREQGAGGASAFREAIDAAVEIAGPTDRSTALRDIAVSQAAVGLVAAARATAALVESPYFRYRALAEIFSNAPAHSDATAVAQEALTTANAIEEPETRARALHDLADRLRGTGLDAVAIGLKLPEPTSGLIGRLRRTLGRAESR